MSMFVVLQLARPRRRITLCSDSEHSSFNLHLKVVLRNPRYFKFQDNPAVVFPERQWNLRTDGLPDAATD